MTYQYYCDKCKKPQEAIKPMSESSNKEYCMCGGELRRVYSSTAIRTADGFKK